MSFGDTQKTPFSPQAVADEVREECFFRARFLATLRNDRMTWADRELETLRWSLSTDPSESAIVSLALTQSAIGA